MTDKYLRSFLLTFLVFFPGALYPETVDNPQPGKMQLGVLERRLTQLRPLFDYSDGKWKQIPGDSKWNFGIVPKNCVIFSEEKVVANLDAAFSNYPVRSDCASAELRNTLILAWDKLLPTALADAKMLSHPLPVACGPGNSHEGWKRTNNFSEKERTTIVSAFLKLEPVIHVCQQNPKLMMGADPNQRELDVHLQPKDLDITGLRSKKGEILAEVTPKYKEMCGKPNVFTGRWQFIARNGESTDLGYDLQLIPSLNGASLRTQPTEIPCLIH